MLRTFIVSFAAIIIYAGEDIIDIEPSPIMYALANVYTRAVVTIEEERSSRDPKPIKTQFHRMGPGVSKSLNDCPIGISRMDCLLRRLKKFTNCADGALLISHIYLDQLLAQNQKEIQFNQETSLILVYVSVISTIKQRKNCNFLSDEQYGSIVGIPGGRVASLVTLFGEMVGEFDSLNSKFEEAKDALLRECK